MTDAAITVDGVKKRYRIYRRHETTLKSTIIRGRRGVYDEFAALDGVSFEIPRGQAVGIVGRNGAGKSTLLKLLARIIDPDAGHITIDGRVSALLEVGAGFHPEYTAIENIYLSGAIYGIPRKRSREPRSTTSSPSPSSSASPTTPSRRTRAACSRGSASRSRSTWIRTCCSIDEVLAVGDQSFQARCIDRMLEFRNAGKTLVLVTHDLGAVESFCERAIWIDKGLVREDALPHHVIRAYVADVNEQDHAQSASRAAREQGTRGRAAHAGARVPSRPPDGDELHVARRYRARGLPDGRAHARAHLVHGAPRSNPTRSASSTSSDTTACSSLPRRRA